MKSQFKSKPCISAVTPVPQVTFIADANVSEGFTNDLDENTSDIDCLICEEECIRDSVICDCCNAWIHYKCEKLTKRQIKYLDENPSELYSCTTCMDLIMFENYNRAEVTEIEYVQNFPETDLSKINKNQSNINSKLSILQPKTKSIELNTDIVFKDMEQLEELQQLRKKLVSREKEVTSKERALKEKEKET